MKNPSYARFLLPLVMSLFLVACGAPPEEAPSGEGEPATATAEVSPEPATIDEAIARGDIEAIRAILADDAAAASAGARPGMPPLHQAILRKKPEIALLLIESGAEVNAVDSSKRTPLHISVDRDLPELIGPLIKGGADPDLGDQAGWTPLHLAGAKDRVAAARALLQHGADISRISDLGGTPLHEAAASGSEEIIRLYLDAGVDPTVVAEGGTALDIAREFENEAAIKLLTVATGKAAP